MQRSPSLNSAVTRRPSITVIRGSSAATVSSRPTIWRPVEAHCAKLGPRFRFFHVSPLAGFITGEILDVNGGVAMD